jgi:hypothetical protein
MRDPGADLQQLLAVSLTGMGHDKPIEASPEQVCASAYSGRTAC